MSKINNKQRREISYALSTYIFKRLWANRKLQMENYFQIKDQIVDLDVYYSLVKLQTELIDQIDSKGMEGNWVEYFVKEIIKKIDDASINRIMEEAVDFVIKKYGSDEMKLNFFDAMVHVLNYLKTNVSRRVILSNDTINNIKTLVEYYVERFDFKDFGYINENEILIKMLGKIITSSKDQNMKSLAEKCLTFFCSSNTAGFDSKISGCIGFGNGNIITIHNENDETLFTLDQNGVCKKRYNESEDYILFGSDIIIGARLNDQGKVIHEIGRLILDNGELFFHTLLTDNKVYPLIVERSSEADMGYIFDPIYLGALLKKLGLAEHYKIIYSECELKDLVQLINKYQRTPKEDFKKFDETSAKRELNKK